MKPLVSVIVPVHNDELYVGDAIKSLLDQTYSNLEILVIDDASIDSTLDIVMLAKHSRIRVFRNITNLGLAASVNLAIRQASGKYIARMDADDLSAPTRIEKQIQFMERHPEIDIVGTAMQSFGYGNYVHQFPIDHDACKARLLFNVCFGHPTVLIKKSVFNDPTNYYKDELQQYSEEYELWCRLVDRYRFANLREPLVKYRTFKPTIKQEAERKRRINSFTIRKNFIEKQFGTQSAGQYQKHDLISNLAKAKSVTQIEEWISWLQRMREINYELKRFGADALQLELSNRCFEVRYWNSQLGLQNMLNCYFKDDSRYSPTMKQNLRFIMKSIGKF